MYAFFDLFYMHFQIKLDSRIFLIKAKTFYDKHSTFWSFAKLNRNQNTARTAYVLSSIVCAFRNVHKINTLTNCPARGHLD